MVGNLGTELPTGSDRKETWNQVNNKTLQIRPQTSFVQVLLYHVFHDSTKHSTALLSPIPLQIFVNYTKYNISLQMIQTVFT
jgi:hypothetical protein